MQKSACTEFLLRSATHLLDYKDHRPKLVLPFPVPDRFNIAKQNMRRPSYSVYTLITQNTKLWRGLAIYAKSRLLKDDQDQDIKPKAMHGQGQQIWL